MRNDLIVLITPSFLNEAGIVLSEKLLRRSVHSHVLLGGLHWVCGFVSAPGESLLVGFGFWVFLECVP